MYRFAVRLVVSAERPLTLAQLGELARSRYGLEVVGRVRTRTLRVSLEMAGSDAVGALARAQNVVLDIVPGTVRRAEVELLRRR